LPDNANVLGIENMLRSFPHEMTIEIWKAIGEAVPGWGMSPLHKPAEIPTE
jgi:hypothetical protein